MQGRLFVEDLASKKANDGKWRITQVVQPHTYLSNEGKTKHAQLSARYFARHIFGFMDIGYWILEDMGYHNITLPHNLSHIG